MEGKQKVNINLPKIISDIDTTEIVQSDSSSADSLVKNFTIKKDNILHYNRKGSSELARFFSVLKQSNKNKIRILHFGDSQIEGDRMTSFIRERMQEKFGGLGPGFIAAVNHYGTISFTEKHSKNWIRYTNFRGEKLSRSNDYGILNRVGRFTKEYTVSHKRLKLDTAWIEIGPGTKTYQRTQNYNCVKLFYTDTKTPCAINVYKAGQLIRHDSLVADGKYHIDSLSFEQNPGVLKFEFIAKTSPNILGFSLEGKTGVQVDNIAMRGSSGLFLEQSNKKLFKKILSSENVQLFIMQFGGNAVPYIKDSAQARDVVYRFRQQLRSLKRLRPEATIIVIGPSDMSQISEGDFSTYPILPYYIKILKSAVVKEGFAYFDTFKAMGGKNAMVVWNKNGLAQADHIHFTRKGAKIVAQQFYNALMTAYTK